MTNHKGARGAYIHDVIVAQLSREDTWAEGSVTPNIDTAEKNHEAHPGIMKKKANGSYRRLCLQWIARTGPYGFAGAFK